LGERWSEQTDQVVRKHLASVSADLGTIDKLAGVEGGRFALNLAPDPYTILLPNLSGVRASCKLKSLEVIAKAMRGDVGSLVRDADIMIKHGRVLADEPVLISSLVHIATDSLTIETIERVLAQTPVKADQILQIEAMLKSIEEEDRMSWGLRGERAMIIGGGRWLVSSGGRGLAGLQLPVPVSTPGVGGWFLSGLATSIELENGLVRAKDAKERRQAAAYMDSAVQAAPRYNVPLKTLVPSLVRACELDERLTALSRAARTALAVERYRMDKGRFPDKLDQLVPGYLDVVPVDPFTDLALRYKIEPDAVIVYSVGDDKSDDGGKVRQRVPPRTSPADWGFVLLKPEFRGRPPSTAPAVPGSAPESSPSTMIPLGVGG
jgi:hypothetical protein